VRFVAISVVFAMLLSLLYVILIREVTGDSNRSLQRSVCLFIARMVESDDYTTSLQRIESYRSESKSLPLRLWVLTDAGAVLASNTPAQPPAQWRKVALPNGVHAIATYARSFPALPEFAVVRLAATAPTYLVLQDLWVESRRLLFLESMIFIATLVGAIFLGLSLVTLYMRMRSREAKRVIAAMKGGELSARFTLGRLDALGRVMLDFNDMANEVERLVNRLRTTENTRRELLQELGHDLRTPLTSLRTSAETLLAHWEQMPAQDRSELSSVIKGELDYLQRLIEDLFFIADLQEPRYTHRAEQIDLLEAVRAEASGVSAATEAVSSPRINIEVVPPQAPLETLEIAGDRHMIGRLLRNAIENAARHARASVRIEFATSNDSVQVSIDDDGPGMSPEAIASFGQRRTQRVLPQGGDTFASLGLGAVIIKSVTSSHGGSLKIESVQAGHAVRGTRLTFSFPH
jgi:signal transduction histidine kinase